MLSSLVGHYSSRVVRIGLIHFQARYKVTKSGLVCYGRPLEYGRPLCFWPVVSSSFFLSIFFPRLISAVADWMSAILLHMESANLRCTSETCCTWLAGNAGPKTVTKNCHRGTIAQLCWAISSQLRHISTIGKKTNFAALNRGRHLCSAGRPSCRAAHILVVFILCCNIISFTGKCLHLLS